MKSVLAWDRLGRFVLLHPCLVLTGVLWAILALFFPTERPGVEIDLGRICEVSGWVRSSLRRLDDRIQFDLQPEQTLQGDRHVQVPGRIQVYFPAPAEGIPELYYGQRIVIRAFLREPSFYAAPGVLDWRQHLWRRGVLLQVNLKSFRQLSLTGGLRGCPLRRWLDWYRGRFVSFCEQRFSPRTLSLILGSFLGESSALESAREDLVRRLGVVHLFVVSGLHVGLLLIALLRLFRPLGAAGQIIALAGVWAYVGVTGASTSAVRAGLMTTYACLLNRTSTRGRLLNHLGIAGLVLLAANPAAHGAPGLQFSFLSLLSLGLGSEVISKLQYALTRGTRIWEDHIDLAGRPGQRGARRLRFLLESWLEPVRCGGVSAFFHFLGRPLGFFAGLILASLLVQIATLPVSLYYSNLWSWSQWLANLVLIPLFGLLIPAGFLLLAAFWTPLAALAAVPVEALSWLVDLTLSVQGHLAVVTLLRQPSKLEILGYFLFLAFALLLRGSRRWVILAAPWLLYVFLAAAPPVAPERMIVTMLDVGQGESLHLRYPDGRDALVDTGGFALAGEEWTDFVGARIVSRYLWSQRVRELKFVLLSHPHLDHIQGLPFLARAFPIDSLYYHEPHRIYDRKNQLQLAAGDRFTIAGVHHEILHPSEEMAGSGWGTNDTSLVLMLRFGRFSLLLTGDIEKRAERELTGRMSTVTALKVAHHGSQTSTSRELLSSARPGIALISAGRNNRFGHPSKQTLQRLKEQGSRVLLTSELGTVRIETDGFCWTASHFSMETKGFVEIFTECAD